MKIDELKYKGKKSLFGLIFSRTGIIIFFLALQVILMFYTFKKFSTLSYILSAGTFIAIGMYLLILNTDQNVNVKLMWVILIFVLPIFGSLLYLYIYHDFGYILFKKRLSSVQNQTKGLLKQDEITLSEIKELNKDMYNISRYINSNMDGNVYKDTQYKYFSQGEDMFYSMLEDIKNAKEYIFLEYFKIKNGYMWGHILSELITKATQGVEVRLIYDGTCTFIDLPYNYPKKLEKYGIKVTVHAQISPILSTHYNNRDHRKILIVDGIVSYTGGINIADEYINYINRYGHWKDTAVRISGNITNEFTLMFLQMWNTNNKYEKLEYNKYFRYRKVDYSCQDYSIAYNDSPFNDELMAENVYLDIINNAKDYVYITTPYFIIDDDVCNALVLAAKKSIDVSIILPYKSDQKIAQYISKTYYSKLIQSGVKIYEYSEGFIHSKMMVADDKTAVIGTINLDYRSLYHHFECAVYIYNNPVIIDMKNDILKTINKSQIIIEDTIFNENTLPKLVGFIGRLIAPLI